ncbi:hypothetical protein [Halococcoides cellulosivorans]|uniref:DUF4352 domain-containing protein n=1 Tax=Halococcoides cellulosivorans TaxID=1679096 RepID=A0A2R4WY54_9EURY|nr:hypothetical protein [Halococcoides cellulosivorans]AWB26450.1 hypothetical protein HARCEL1_01320 [Halococcoides cellulosivorans]
MDRRDYLATLSTVSIAALGGCTGTGGGALPFGDATNVTVGTEYVDHRQIEYLVDRVDIARRYETADETVRQADSGSMFVFAHVTATNTEGVTELPGVEGLALLHGGDQVQPVTDLEAGDRFVSPVSGPVLEPVGDAKPGTSTEGWIVFEAPDDWSSPRVSVTLPPEDESDSETVAEWRTEIDPATLPDIGVDEIEAAGNVSIGENVTVDVAFRNDGGSNGSWAEAATIQPSHGENRTERLTVDVPANRTRSQNFTVPADALGDLRVQVGTETAVTTVEAASLELGTTLELPSDVNMTVHEITTADRVTVLGVWDAHINHSPDTGNQFAFVRLGVLNDTGSSKPIPPLDQVTVQAGGNAYNGTRVSATASEIQFPVQGRLYDPTSGLRPNHYVEGWAICEVPQDLDPEAASVSVGWAGSNGPVGARWS